MRGEFDLEPAPQPGWGLGPVLESFHWAQARAEVEKECQARIVIAGLCGAGKSTLLNQLRGWEVSPPGDGKHPAALRQEDLGFFALLDLPADACKGDPVEENLEESGHRAWSLLSEADLILFLLDGEALCATLRPQEGQPEDREDATPPVSLRLAEYHWFCRVRSLGRPLIVALNKADLLGSEAAEVLSELERRLASRVLLLSAREGTGIESALLPCILAACPELAVPLGRELPSVRRRAVRQIIRQTALLSGLTGLEPVPLVDIPIQLAAQMRMLLKLAALHGRLETGDGSRELLATVAGGLGVRFAAQQVAKLVPVLGWVASGFLSALTTWCLGWATVAYLDGSLQERASALRRLRPRPRICREGGPQVTNDAKMARWRHRFRLWPSGRRRGRRSDQPPSEERPPTADSATDTPRRWHRFRLRMPGSRRRQEGDTGPSETQAARQRSQAGGNVEEDDDEAAMVATFEPE